MPERLAHAAREIVRRLQAAGHAAYWVGGCVRDLQLGREPQDYDIATSARPAEVEALFPRCRPVGRQFGVVVVVLQGHPFQVATFRAEAGYPDGRHPARVTFTSAEEDARRRDFTINGLFLDPLTGQLHDWVGGGRDLQLRLIRTIGPPEHRFAEDHLRLLRAARFAAQLDFDLAPATLQAVRKLAPALRKVSAERVREELTKLFHPACAARGLDWLERCALLDVVLPEVAALAGCVQDPAYHPEGDVLEHVRRMMRLLPPDADPLLPWAVMLHDIGKPACQSLDEAGRRHFYQHEKVGAKIADALCRRLRFPNAEREALVECVRSHMKYHQARQMRRSTLRRLLLRPTAALEVELHRLDCASSGRDLANYEFLQQARRDLAAQPALTRPLLTGKDLLALGLSPGPAVGQLLKEAREKQLQGELQTPEDARSWACRKLSRPPDDKDKPPPA
ncbi:MAG: CCA tRNA nucleotidyltransferase [Verrucomicrobiae bacterium]|nr:CCA tRNA nucleotidyltransferase [Verrucomicrobiae bacterium]